MTTLQNKAALVNGAEATAVRLGTSKGCHKVFDLAVRRGFAGFKVTLDAQSGRRSTAPSRQLQKQRVQDARLS
jgi:hypothetical protein